MQEIIARAHSRPTTRATIGYLEVRLTTALVTELDDGCNACALVEELRARRLTGWKIFQ